MVWYGWIPILTSRILSEHCIERIEKNLNEEKGEWKRPSEEDKKLLDKDLRKNNGVYYQCLVNEDRSNEKFKFIISVENNKIDHAVVFNGYDERSTPNTHADCSFVDNSSIVAIKLREGLDPWTEKKKIQQIYAKIRDVYHMHTHHEKSIDLLLEPVEQKSLSEVNGNEFEEIKKSIILEILKQYEQKIVDYLRTIKEDITAYDEDARKTMTKAKGEMKYASSFVNLFKEEIKEYYKSYSFIFSNALRCIDLLSHDIEAKHTHELNKQICELTTQMTKLTNRTTNLTYFLAVFTIIIALLTAPVAVDALLSILEHIYPAEPNVSPTIVYIGTIITISLYVIILLFAGYTLKESQRKT